MRIRGLTLVEVLIACALMSLLWLALLAFLVAGRSLYGTSSDRAANLGTLAQALDRIEFDMLGSNAGEWQFQSSGNWVGMRSCRDASGQVVTDANGNYVPQHWVVYYQFGSAILRREDPLASYTYTYLIPRNGTGTQVAANVASFSVDIEENDNQNSYDYVQSTVGITLKSFAGSHLEDSQSAQRKILNTYIP